MGEAVQSNYLVISDLHLGEDIGRDLAHEHIERVEQDLVAFLDHHAGHRLDDQPWHLVINGDMVDFLSICLMPAEVGELTGFHDDDHLYGLGGSARAGRAKLRAVLERHEEVFAALAHFVGVGNQLSIVLGNHDAELFWPEVQEAFREALMGLWARDPRRTAGDPRPEAVGAALAFHPWFLFIEDLVWIEHGHQYDTYCSFDAILNPVTADGREIDLNISTVGMRYVSNHYAPHSHDEEFGFWDYLGWAARQRPSTVVAVGAAYLAANLRLVRNWWQLTAEARRARRQKHLERLRALAGRHRLSEKVLMELDDLRQRPMGQGLGRILRGLMLDRLLITLAAVLLLPLMMFTVPWSWIPLAGVFVIGGMAWVDRRFTQDRPTIYPQENMKRVALAIRRLVRAPIVVFGHSHAPAFERHEDGGCYVNTGTWVAERKEDLVRAFTHLRIRVTRDGPRPELCQWRQGRSLAFKSLPGRA